jgi:hypothetical protein
MCDHPCEVLTLTLGNLCLIGQCPRLPTNQLMPHRYLLISPSHSYSPSCQLIFEAKLSSLSSKLSQTHLGYRWVSCLWSQTPDWRSISGLATLIFVQPTGLPVAHQRGYWLASLSRLPVLASGLQLSVLAFELQLPVLVPELQLSVLASELRLSVLASKLRLPVLLLLPNAVPKYFKLTELISSHQSVGTALLCTCCLFSH